MKAVNPLNIKLEELDPNRRSFIWESMTDKDRVPYFSYFTKNLFLCSGELSNKNVNVTTIIFFMSGDLTGLCL